MSQLGSPTALGRANRRSEQKQRTSIYTMMLLLAFVATTIGWVVLWLELREYGEYPWWRTDGVPAVTSQLDPGPGPPTAVKVVDSTPVV